MSQDPLFLDLIGTCHSDSTKPVILTPQHLTWYRTHLARGLTLYPPDILAAMLKEKKLERDENGALMLPIEVCGVPAFQPHTEAGCFLQDPHPSLSKSLSRPVPYTTVAGDDLHGAFEVFSGKEGAKESHRPEE